MSNYILSGAAKLIADATPPLWGPMLLGQVLDDEIQKIKSLSLSELLDHDHADFDLSFHIVSFRKISECMKWMTSRFSALTSLAEKFAEEFPIEGSAHQNSILGLHGNNADATKIAELGVRMGQAYRKILFFTENVRATTLIYSAEFESDFKNEVENYWNSSRDYIVGESTNLARFCETVGPTIIHKIRDAQSAPDTGVPIKLNLGLTFKFSATEFNFDSLTKKLNQKTVDMEKALLQTHVNSQITKSSALVPLNRLAELKTETDELRRELLNALTHLVFKHGNTLLRKMSQTIYHDDYGNPYYDKFRREQEYFIKTVMCRDIPDPVWNALFLDKVVLTPLQVLDDLLRRYEAMPDSASCLDQELDPAMSGIEYERLCAKLLERAGWHTKVTTSTGDQGVDVIAKAGKMKLVVQCKLYSNSVGTAAVQEIIAGREFERADFAAVVSNASFTPSAQGLAAASNVSLLHHSQLDEFHTKLGIVFKPMQDQTSTPIKSPDQIATYLDALDCRPINEIVQQAMMLTTELDDLTLAHQSDLLLDQAIAVVVSNDKGSISLVQRHLKVGYNQAARLIEDMEKMGVVSPMNSNGQRVVLVKSVDNVHRLSTSISGDRAVPDIYEVRLMVEENWRKFLIFAAEGWGELGKQSLLKFEQSIRAKAANMPSETANTFLRSIEVEREKIFNEYTHSPERLKQRLGVEIKYLSSKTTASPLGNLVLNTAVRATVWESVRAIFRAFR